MANDRNHFEFTAVLLKEAKHSVSLCLDVDVASQGASPREARKMLAEAVTLYLETCFENRIPYLRPVSREDAPRVNRSERVLEFFPLKVDFKVHTFV